VAVEVAVVAVVSVYVFEDPVVVTVVTVQEDVLVEIVDPRVEVGEVEELTEVDEVVGFVPVFVEVDVSDVRVVVVVMHDSHRVGQVFLKESPTGPCMSQNDFLPLQEGGSGSPLQ
jgi:hypothetical protein